MTADQSHPTILDQMINLPITVAAQVEDLHQRGSIPLMLLLIITTEDPHLTPQGSEEAGVAARIATIPLLILRIRAQGEK